MARLVKTDLFGFDLPERVRVQTSWRQVANLVCRVSIERRIRDNRSQLRDVLYSRMLTHSRVSTMLLTVRCEEYIDLLCAS